MAGIGFDDLVDEQRDVADLDAPTALIRGGAGVGKTTVALWAARREVLHLHYRTAFRYRFYTSAADIDADLAAWLRFYNFERPHRGYRTKGRRPAEIFYADAPALLAMKGWDADEFTPQSVRQ